jgi:hypothetical protein
MLPTLLLGMAVGLGTLFACGDDDDDDDDNDAGDDDAADDDAADDDAGDDDDTADDDSGDDDTGDDDTGGDTWTDTSSGLMWQNASDCCYAWDAAKTYCQDLTWGGYSDWRLPSISELRSLIRGCDATETGGSCGVTDSCLDSSCWNQPCSGCAYLDGSGPSGIYWPPELSGEVSWYWSSSAVADGDNLAWFVNFFYGYVSYNIGNDYHARCVR